MEAAIETAIEPEIESAIEPEIDHVTAFDPDIERVELDIVATGAEIDIASHGTDISAVKVANSFDEPSVSPALIEVTDLSATDVGAATGSNSYCVSDLDSATSSNVTGKPVDTVEATEVPEDVDAETVGSVEVSEDVKASKYAESDTAEVSEDVEDDTVEDSETVNISEDSY
ncbi:unnamed protein product [Ambrosiozyma monospora]|uniref:Unnamed protein product n=1 Tax=Ambrosiozyma monospora TaxID=43982 RepID=A0A9W6WBV6_AMBMO|nr:unnamed protein product [Ambrosiozyma monospora]